MEGFPKLPKSARIQIAKKGGIPELRISKFVRVYLKTANLTEAALTAYPGIKRTTARNMGAKLIKRPEIQQKLAIALKRADMNMDELVGIKKDIIAQGAEQLPEKDISPELLNKTIDGLIDFQLRAQEKNPQHNINTFLNIDIDTVSLKELAIKAKKQLRWFDSITEDAVEDPRSEEQKQKSKQLREDLDNILEG